MPCTSGKATFATEAAALWTIEIQNGNRAQRGLPPIPLYVYTCPDCGGLHLTKRRQELPSTRVQLKTQAEIDANDWLAEVTGKR